MTDTNQELINLKALPECEYWDHVNDRECLRYDSVVEALAAWTDDYCDLDIPPAQLEEEIKNRAPNGVTLYGWTRSVVDSNGIQGMTNAAVEAVLEYFSETLNLSGPDIDGEPVGKLPELLKAAIEEDMRDRSIWACEQTHSITLTSDAVIMILKDAQPDWFSTKTSTDEQPSLHLCIQDGRHLSARDADGCCIYCGEQDVDDHIPVDPSAPYGTKPDYWK